MSNDNWIATFERSEQCTEDSWSLSRKAMTINRDTTIGEIEDWFKRYLPDVPMSGVQLISIDKSPTKQQPQ